MKIIAAVVAAMLLLSGAAVTHAHVGKLFQDLNADKHADAKDLSPREQRQRIDRAYRWSVAANAVITLVGLWAIGAYLGVLHQRLLEEQHAVAKVDHQSELFRTTLNNMDEAVIATDQSGRVTFLNSVAESLTGWQKETAAGQPLEEVFQTVHEATRKPATSPIAQSLMEGSASPLLDHTLLIARDGTERSIADKAAPIRDARGQTTGAVLVFHEVTDAKRLEAQVRQSQKLETIGRLAGGIAHDFNNLLTVINGYCQLIESDPTLSENSRGFLAEIHRAGDRATALTQQLLAFSRAQLLPPTRIDLNEVVASASTLLKRLIGDDVIMHVNLAKELWTIKADRGQIEQILINFAVNARDAMPAGGAIFIDTANVHITADGDVAEGQYVLLSFRDSGTGMDESVRKRIFEPYFTTKEYGKGTGLGLATVLGIVKHSGGHISVASQPGAGTTFRVYLPKA